MHKLYEYKTFDDANMIVESSKDGKNLYMKGIFLQADIRNQNQRIYPLREIRNAVTSLQEKIKSGQSVMGELDHPQELSINLDRVSHVIENLWMDGSNGYGKLRIITTPMGQIAKTLIESGVKLGVSSRGSGEVDDNGYVRDFEIITVDIVATPSAPEALPTPIYESLYNMKGGESIYTLAEDASHNEPNAQKHLDKAILKFIQELKL